MRSAFRLGMLSITLLGLLGAGHARDIVIPAGTLMQCTLDEPNFSSATADVGDPILCHPRAVQQFGQSVFPRGTYLVGHLEAAKDPGHFVGKGYLKLEFDRIGLPNTDLPLPGKVIAVRGYHVDKEGKIIGKGHAKRDIVEWMLPPLWPWKVLMLPARGPRPALKGETALTMRLMDDVAIPQTALSPWHRFGQPTADAYRPSMYSPRDQGTPMITIAQNSVVAPAPEFQPALQTVRLLPPVEAAAPPVTRAEDKSVDADVTAAQEPAWHYYGQRATLTDGAATTQSATPASAVTASDAATPPAKLVSAAPVARVEAAAPKLSPVLSPKLTLLVLKTGTVYAVADYWIDNNSLSYVLANGGNGALDLQDMDWGSTTQLNSERSVRVTLRSGQANN